VVGGHRTVVVLAVATVVLRLPLLGAPEGADEGGYLAVARQWHGAGPSLYGHYWVDRPPLLITLFQLCSALGGMPAVRVLGALAAAVAVLGVAEAARLLAGGRAAVAGAGLATALFVSPQLGTVQVNGELLSAPFVAWSVALWLRAVPVGGGGQPGRRRAAASALGAGALAASALLVKQNMVDPLVFGAVAGLVAWRTGVGRGSELRRAAAYVVGGFASALVVVGAWTAVRGASLAGVFNAMYPFRARAARVLATLPDQGQADRSVVFLHTCITSGLVLVVGAFVWELVRRRVAGPGAWGLSALLAWATVSIVVSGGFWDHYLVQAIVPVATAGGVALGSTELGRGVRAHLLPVVAGATVVVVAATHWTLAWGSTMSYRGASAGRAIGAVAAPGDTIISVMGDAETVEVSGLTSPYPYLWTLPAQVDDPHLDRLTALLAGSDAPTWVVPWNRPSFQAPVLDRVTGVLAAHYRTVGVVCGLPVLLHVGVTRATPPAEPCSGRLTNW
jgi:hypothetical protein